MNRLLVTLSLVLVTMTAEAAEPWSVERCMEYAAEHSHTVRLQQYDLDASRTERTRAIGAFLPDVYGSVGAPDELRTRHRPRDQHLHRC